ncbi:hypothetical protein [Streptomyces albidoflavus]|uniref:hypothetical protein n=1 Tax=Streptomyces albidoflavus TaxID=1886 RepID=UPI00226DB3EA|nr:hypothetical protein [Streptomyces albidoflavus]
MAEPVGEDPAERARRERADAGGGHDGAGEGRVTAQLVGDVEREQRHDEAACPVDELRGPEPPEAVRKPAESRDQ